MSDDFNDKFKQIADMLGQNSNSNIPDNVKGLLNMFLSPDSKEESSSDDGSRESDTNEKPVKTENDEFADMTRKMKKAVNVLNTNNDPRVNLLNAIKPYLNNGRQQKLQTCMKLIKLGSMTKLMDDII